jgi:hypothetical protein
MQVGVKVEVNGNGVLAFTLAASVTDYVYCSSPAIYSSFFLYPARQSTQAVQRLPLLTGLLGTLSSQPFRKNSQNVQPDS